MDKKIFSLDFSKFQEIFVPPHKNPNWKKILWVIIGGLSKANGLIFLYWVLSFLVCFFNI
jgi:hypothetical protein